MNDGQKSATTPEPQAFQPGQTISPGGSVTAMAEPAPVPAAQPTPHPAPSAPSQEPAAAEPLPEPESEAEPAPLPADGEAVRPYNGKPLITWTASEFIAHDKAAGWYGVLGLVGLIIAGLVYLILRDIISTTVVLVCTVLFGVYAARKPRQISYQLDDAGILIGRRQYTYHEFRSFAVVDEGPFASVVFMPLKRFAPLLSVYFDPEDEDAVTGILADHLPVEPRQLDLLERALKKIRF